MKNILTIFKKEFYRVMSDKRLIFTTIFLPGLAIFVMYSFMGNAINDVETDIQSHKMIIYTENMPVPFRNVVNQHFDDNPDFRDIEDYDFETIEMEIKEGDADLFMRFDEDFLDVLAEYDELDPVLPNVEIYYNPSERYGGSSLSRANQFISAFIQLEGVERWGDSYHVMTINADNDGIPHIIEYENKGIGQGLAMLLPMLIIMFLFSGAMSIGPDSIAGEKERGTIATLLITPVKRSEIAIGKVLSLSVISLFSATSSFIGIMLSLDKLIGNTEISSFDIYGLSEFAMLFGIIFSTVLVIVGIISVVSAYAKTIKEASMLILPFYFISVITGISTMFSGEASTEMFSYLIPIYNSVNMIIAILTFEVDPTFFLITISSSVVYVSIFIFILNKLFQSETIMFSK
jgi:sodium transport system permease protein